MKKREILIFFIAYLIFSQINSRKIYAESGINSIIKSFCIQNLKNEMLKANIKYQDELGEETCNCYLDNFLEDMNHTDSVNECKIKTKNKFNL